MKADPDKVPPDGEMHVKTTGPEVEEKLPELGPDITVEQYVDRNLILRCPRFKVHN